MRIMWRIYGWFGIVLALYKNLFIDKTNGDTFLSVSIFALGVILAKNHAPETIGTRIANRIADKLSKFF